MSKLIFDRNKSGTLIVSIMIFVLHLSITVGINPTETNEALGRSCCSGITGMESPASREIAATYAWQ
jgi:hypothetical protein